MKTHMPVMLAAILRWTASAVSLTRKKHKPHWIIMRAVSRTQAAAVLLCCAYGAPAYSGTIHGPFSGTYFFVPSEAVSGTTPNALPFTETFDQYPVPFSFYTSTNGWVQNADDTSHTVPLTELPVTPVEPSLFAGNCLSLNTEGQILYNVTTGHVQNVWIDMSAVMVPSEEVPWEEMISGHQFGLFLDSNNRLNAYCGLTNGFIASGIQFASYPGQSVRLTLQIAYADNLTIPYFRVFIDQTNVVWDAGFRLPDVPSERGGAWLPCAATNRTFNGLGLAGSAHVDNITFSGAYLGVDAPPLIGIAQAVAVFWRSDYGRSYQVEFCEDLAVGDWRPFGDPVLGNGTTNTVFDSAGSAARKFYRLISR